jgi:uncharacterized protein with HEPN domain
VINKHDPIPHLEDILSSISWIEDYSSGLTLEEIMENQMVQDAIVRRIEIIGEAVGRLPDNIKKENAVVPWQDIKDMRNKLIHDYGHVDMELVWAVVERDLPKLKASLQEILDFLSSADSNPY